MENNIVSNFSKQQIESFFLNSNVEISIANFIFAILISAILAFVIKITYIKISKSLNDKEHFSDTFVPLAIITTLVITVVKFSLALSLGLVGALSIVRFRAAIKEPEELVYLFFVIGIGLATGANQFFIAIVATFITILILYFRKVYNDKTNKDNLTEASTNILQMQVEGKDQNSDEILNKIKKNVNYLNLKSFSSENEFKQFNFWFDIDKKKLDIFLKDIEKITSENKSIKIQIFSRSGIYE
ncbi:DUF4956 domain-containing protein [Candidatus Pelagibacter sp.]|uniref:DUF4956 domain-containing protein n=1 Tax=Candidatus Pelagibacter sp. TaxID=2024849 RepID=UPI003F85B0B9